MRELELPIEPTGELCVTPHQKFYGIMGREKCKGKFKPFDYQKGNFVTNIIYQTLWSDKAHVDKLVEAMNRDNPDYEFKAVPRS